VQTADDLRDMPTTALKQQVLFFNKMIIRTNNRQLEQDDMSDES